MDKPSTEVKSGMVTFRTWQGVEISAALLRLDPFEAVLEIRSPNTVTRTSEALEDFRVFLHDQPVYSGRAVVRDSLNTRTVVVCSLVLDEHSLGIDFFTSGQHERLRERFHQFVGLWQGVCRVLPSSLEIVSGCDSRPRPLGAIQNP